MKIWWNVNLFFIDFINYKLTISEIDMQRHKRHSVAEQVENSAKGRRPTL